MYLKPFLFLVYSPLFTNLNPTLCVPLSDVVSYLCGVGQFWDIIFLTLFRISLQCFKICDFQCVNISRQNKNSLTNIKYTLL